MNRRSFLKALTLSPIVPGVLLAKEPKTNGTIDDVYFFDKSLTDKEISRMCNTMSEPVIWTTWSSMDGVAMCRFEKGKWVNVVIEVTDFGNNQSITII